MLGQHHTQGFKLVKEVPMHGGCKRRRIREKTMRLQEEIIKGKELAAKMLRLSKKFQQTIKKIDELNK